MSEVVASKAKLTGIEYAWACWPLVLVFMGGALGGLCGGAAAGINVKIFNSARSAKFKYAVSLLVSFGGVAAYLLAAVVLVLVFPSLGKR